MTGGRNGSAATSGMSRIRSVAAPMKLSSVQVSRKRGWYRVILDFDQVRTEFVGHARRIYDTAQVCGIWLQEVA